MLLAGVGKRVITPKVGAYLYGYGDRGMRANPSTGVHDDLHARALVLRSNEVTLALCSIELCYLRWLDVKLIRQRVEEQTGIPAQDVFLVTTHTHSGPATHLDHEWDVPLVESAAAAIVDASQSVQRARLGSGMGFLHNWHINRRWLDRPVDPAVAVLRVDTHDGQPLATIGMFGCHAVVLGQDNLLISGDWPGYFSRQIEATLGGVALFFPGGAGDANPLTSVIRERIKRGDALGTLGERTTYYGSPYDYNIEDRTGGTFEEAEELGRAVHDEVLRVWHSITLTDAPHLWSDRVVVNGKVGPDEAPAPPLPPEWEVLLPELRDGTIPMECLVVGIGDLTLVGQPGETFSENAVALRVTLQRMGYKYPYLVTYANGCYAYLPPSYVWDEGGYEVEMWCKPFGVSRHVQQRLWDAVMPLLEQHKP